MRIGANRPSAFRWAGLACLLLAEAVGLSVCVDTSALSGETAWWAWVLGHAGQGVALILVGVAACAVVVWTRAGPTQWRIPEPRSPGLKLWLLLGAHVVAFAGFAALTVVVVERNIGKSPHCALWLLAWAATGLAAAGLWAAAAMPPARWLRLVREGWSVALGGLVISAAALGIGHLSDTLWRPLRGPTFWLVDTLLRASGQETVSKPDEFLLGSTTFSVSIAPECSGYEGIGLIWVFAGAYLWLFRRSLRFPQALLLIPVGTVAVWLANAVRLAALVIIGTRISPDIALGGFHSQIGWLAFIAVALGLVAVAQRMPFFRSVEQAAAPGTRNARATVAYLAPMMALVAVAMVTGAFLAGFDWLYPLRVLAVAGVTWVLWRGSFAVAGLRGAWSWGAVAIGGGVFGVWLALEWAIPQKEAGSAIATGLAGMSGGWAALWLVFRVVGSVVTVPVAEELAFRGYLVRRLIASDFDNVPPQRFTWLSFLASSVLFGASHGRWVAGTVAGLFYAWAMYRRGRIADAMVAHATTNALLAAYVLSTGSWSLWV